jgi:hypothetical protein
MNQRIFDVGRVVSCKLDHLLAEPVDFLKIDIEGAEVDALLASTKLRNVKRIFVEYHSFCKQKQRLHELLQTLTDSGLRYYIKTIFSPYHAFLKQETHAGMDLQLNISCVRNDAN